MYGSYREAEKLSRENPTRRDPPRRGEARTAMRIDERRPSSKDDERRDPITAYPHDP
jgi:hypothetical protein